MSKIYSDIQISGKFVYDNNPKAGYILVSDSQGVISFATPSVYYAGSGLTLSGSTFSMITPEYYAGTGLSLIGSTFSLSFDEIIYKAGEGLTLSGSTFSMITPEYYAGTGLTLSGSTFSLISGTISSQVVTYSELSNLILNNNLKIGNTYLINDFQTVYDQPDYSAPGVAKTTVTTLTGPVEPLIVTAVENNKISNVALSTIYPDDYILYDHTFIATEVMGVAAKGRITERTDTANNTVSYDIRNVLFKRYDAGGGYFTVYWDNGNASLSTIPTFASNTLCFNNYFVNNYDVLNPPITPMPFLLNNSVFLDTDTYEVKAGHNFYNNTIESNARNLSFGSNCYNNFIQHGSSSTIGNSFINNTTNHLDYTIIKNGCMNNTFDWMDFCYIEDFFQNNTINGHIKLTKIGVNFRDNVSTGSFENMEIEWDCINNSFAGASTCILGNTFRDNIIGSGFGSNKIGNRFLDNTVGFDFKGNIIGASCNDNTLGDSFENNIIATGFYLNIISTGFHNNTIGDDFMNNTIGADFLSNTFGNFCWSNNLATTWEYNNIGNKFQNNITTDLFTTNTIGEGANLNTFAVAHSNNIAFGFVNNIVGNNFRDNIIQGEAVTNNIGTDFIENVVGTNFHRNIIDDDFSRNSLGEDFRDNTIGTNFISNTTSSAFYSNNIGASFGRNKVGVGFTDNTIGEGFEDNNIGNIFRANMVGDFVHDLFIQNEYISNSIASNTNTQTKIEGLSTGFVKNTNGVLQSIAFGVASEYMRGDGTIGTGNLQKVITVDYTLTDVDNDYTIFINNGASAIIITLGAVTVANYSVGFIQEGIADVTFVGATNPIGLKCKGQGYQTLIERKLATSTYYLLGNTKA
jgi:hypothetical protein